MPEETSTSTTGADTEKASPAKRKPKTKTAKKKTTKKKAGAKKKAAAKKATAAKNPPSTAKVDDEKRRGIPPDRSIRFLLLEQQPENEGKSGAEIARMVVCSPNQITKIRERQEEYEKLISGLSAEEKKRRLATVIPKKPRGTRAAKPQQPTPTKGQSAPMVPTKAVAEFRRALRQVGLALARQLLEQFEKEE